MSDIFLAVLKLSIPGSLLILAVLLLRPILGRAPGWISGILWGLVALRLMIPVFPESPVSLIPGSVGRGQVVSELSERYVGEVTYIYEGEEYYDETLNSGVRPMTDGNGNSYVITGNGGLTPPETVGSLILPAAAWFWIVGIAVLLIYAAAGCLGVGRRVMGATPLRDNIKECDRVDSPFIFGIFLPVIYLPSGLPESVASHVIAHEKAHIRHLDHIKKPLGYLILALYWFNPLVWVAYGAFCRDMELACDERVIKGLGHERRADYSEALLSCSVRASKISVCPLAFGESAVKKRVKNVLNYKKPELFIIIAAVFVCAAVAVCLCTVRPKNEAFTALNVDTPVELGEKARDRIKELVTSAFWYSDVPDCAFDWEFSFDGQRYRYHSDCGTFCRYGMDPCSFSLSEEARDDLNRLLGEVYSSDFAGQYRVKELLYACGNYSFVENEYNAPQYMIFEEGSGVLCSNEGALASSTWTRIGELWKYELTEGSFDSYIDLSAPVPSEFGTKELVSSLRDNNRAAFIAGPDTNGGFYIFMCQKDGSYVLCRGFTEKDGREYIRFIQRLEPVDITNIPVRSPSVPPQLTITDGKELIIAAVGPYHIVYTDESGKTVAVNAEHAFMKDEDLPSIRVMPSMFSSQMPGRIYFSFSIGETPDSLIIRYADQDVDGLDIADRMYFDLFDGELRRFDITARFGDSEIFYSFTGMMNMLKLGETTEIPAE